MLLDRLRDAKALRSKKLLESVLDKCDEMELGDHMEVQRGKFILKVITKKEGMLIVVKF